MADDKKKGTPQGRITPEQRMKYIGFEVFPGKPKDLFKSDKEKQSFVERVLARRSKGEIIRDDCKLLESRVSTGERLVLAAASLVIFAALFLPWYSVYTEKAVDVAQGTGTQIEQEEAVLPDSAMAAMGVTADSMQMAAAGDTVNRTVPAAVGTGEAGTTTEESPASAAIDSDEEIITGHTARTRYTREYTTLSGIGSFAALGSVGGSVFGSGFVLMLTGFLYLIYALACLALPLMTIYVAFGLKGSADDVALKLKKYLRYNWIPVIIFSVTLFFSFFGASYASGVIGSFTSLGEAYSPAVFLSTLSWGIYVSMAGFLLIAVKGIEI